MSYAHGRKQLPASVFSCQGINPIAIGADVLDAIV
jgi:hypothetical protein